MDGLELLVLLLSIGLALGIWWRWYSAIHAVTELASAKWQRAGLAITPILCLFLLFTVLRI
jgi:hypothetical protein